jgi:triacylglycerol lipase
MPKSLIPTLIAILCIAPMGCEETGYTATLHPIVLCHGFLGFDSILNGVMDYWYGIEDVLERDGAEVWGTLASPINSSENRGNQIIEQLEEIRAIRGEPNLRFNLIGYLIDDLWTLLAGNDNPNDAMAALSVFDPASVAAFNSDPLCASRLPTTYCGEGEAVSDTVVGPRRNYSWTGNTAFTNPLDPVDTVFGLLGLLYDEPNDGLVKVCGSHFGTVIRDDYRMNHLDEVNLLFGIVSPFEVDPKETFRTHANRLKNAGL